MIVEKNILEDKVKNIQKFSLWIGGISFVIAILLSFLTQGISKRVYNSFHNKYILIEKDISPSTELEIQLKESLLNATKASEEGWYKYSIEKRLRLFQSFFLVGILLIVNYFINRVYLKRR